MLKSDLIAILVAKRGITQKQAEVTVETIFDSMTEALCAGDNIEIRGLGAFHVKDYQGYQGRNPKTGQVIPVKPKRGILFRTGKELRDRVNRGAGSTGKNVMAHATNTVVGAPAAASSSDHGQAQAPVAVVAHATTTEHKS